MYLRIGKGQICVRVNLKANIYMHREDYSAMTGIFSNFVLELSSSSRVIGLLGIVDIGVVWSWAHMHSISSSPTEIQHRLRLRLGVVTRDGMIHDVWLGLCWTLTYHDSNQLDFISFSRLINHECRVCLSISSLGFHSTNVLRYLLLCHQTKNLTLRNDMHSGTLLRPVSGFKKEVG